MDWLRKKFSRGRKEFPHDEDSAEPLAGGGQAENYRAVEYHNRVRDPFSSGESAKGVSVEVDRHAAFGVRDIGSDGHTQAHAVYVAPVYLLNDVIKVNAHHVEVPDHTIFDYQQLSADKVIVSGYTNEDDQTVVPSQLEVSGPSDDEQEMIGDQEKNLDCKEDNDQEMICHYEIVSNNTEAENLQAADNVAHNEQLAATMQSTQKTDATTDEQTYESAAGRNNAKEQGEGLAEHGYVIEHDNRGLELKATKSQVSNEAEENVEIGVTQATDASTKGGDLIPAIKKHRWNEAIKLLQHLQCDVNLRDRDGYTALIWAIREKQENIVTQLLQLPQCDANLQDRDGYTALIWAITEKQENIATQLLQHPQCDVNLRDSDGYTALMWAIREKQENIVTQLLQLPQCDVNLQIRYGYTALIWAIREKQENIATQLLQHPQCDVNLQPVGGNTALITAIIEKQENIVTQLLQHPQCDVNLQPVGGNTALITAIIEKQENIATQLLQHPKCDVNLQTRDGYTALIWAIREKQENIVTQLLQHPQCDVNLQTRDGYTALISAIREKQENIVTQLLQHPKCDVNLQTRDGYTALIRAIIEKQENIVTQVLQHPQCDVNLQPRGGDTALIWAIIEKQENIATQLLQHPQCDVNLRPVGSDTALITAIIEKQENIATQLLQHPKCDVNLQTRDGYTALIWAIREKQENIVTQLLQHPQCDVNLQTRDGYTALISAIREKQENIVTQLLQHPQCDVNLQTRDGYTALIWAIIEKQENIVTQVLQHPQCDVNLQPRGGDTALMWAIREKEETVLLSLIQHPDCDVRTKVFKYAIEEKKFEWLVNILEHRTFDLKDIPQVEIEKADYIAIEAVLRDQSKKGHDNCVIFLLKTLKANSNFKFRDPSLAVWCINKASDPIAMIKTFNEIEGFALDVKTKDDFDDNLITSFFRTWGNVGYVSDDQFYSKMVDELIKQKGATCFPCALPLKRLPNRRLLPSAIKYSTVETCEKIIKIGCDVKGTFCCGEHAVFSAIRLEAIDKLKLLASERSLMTMKWNGMYPLEFSIAHGFNSYIIRYLATKSHLVMSRKVKKDLKMLCQEKTEKKINMNMIDIIQVAAERGFALELNMVLTSGMSTQLTKFAFHGETLLQTARRLDLLSKTSDETVTINTMKPPSTKLKAISVGVDDCSVGDIEQMNLCLNIANSSFETMNILSCLNALLNEVLHRMRNKNHPIQFTYSIVGSVAETTKTFIPDEADLICLIGRKVDIEPIQSTLESFSPTENTIPHIKPFNVRSEKEGWEKFFKRKSDFLSPGKIWHAFHSAVEKELTDMYHQGISFGNLFLHRKSIEQREKISCLQLLWRGRQFNQMVIHVDLVPALPCEGEDFDHVIPKISRHDPEQRDSGFSRSYSNKEIEKMNELPLTMRRGYTYAKALRMKCVSEPKNLSSTYKLHLVQDRRVDDIITSFMLKTITFSLDEKGLVGKTVLQIAKNIYENLRIRIEERELKTTHGDIVFQCRHNHCELASCCIHRKLIMAICDEVIFFLKGVEHYSNEAEDSRIEPISEDQEGSEQTDPTSQDQEGTELKELTLEDQGYDERTELLSIEQEDSKLTSRDQADGELGEPTPEDQEGVERTETTSKNQEDSELTNPASEDQENSNLAKPASEDHKDNQLTKPTLKDHENSEQKEPHLADEQDKIPLAGDLANGLEFAVQLQKISHTRGKRNSSDSFESPDIPVNSEISNVVTIDMLETCAVDLSRDWDQSDKLQGAKSIYTNLRDRIESRAELKSRFGDVIFRCCNVDTTEKRECCKKRHLIVENCEERITLICKLIQMEKFRQFTQNRYQVYSRNMTEAPFRNVLESHK